MLPKGVVEGVASGEDERFAEAVAFAENGRNVVVDHVERRKIDAADDLGSTGLRGLRGDKNNFCGGRDGAGPFDVKIRLEFVAGNQTGIGAIHDDLRVICREAEHSAEIADVLNVDVGLADNGDGLAGAVEGRGAIDAVGDVVDLGEVGGTDGVESAACIGVGEERFDLAGSFIFLEGADLVVLRVLGEIVKGDDAGDDRRESFWDRGVS